MIGGSAGLVVYRLRLLGTSRFRVKILVFTEGTIIREVRGREVRMIGGKVLGDAPRKLRNWSSQGGQIEYLTSRRTPDEIQAVRRTLKENRFPKGRLNYRSQGEEYKDVAEIVVPDIIVEDDCAGTGGEREMTYPHIRPDIKQRIVSVVVREFEGIDQLPDRVLSLLDGEYSSRPAR